jgi:hypothetical protein
VVKPNGISTTWLSFSKRVRHIPMQFENARTHVIKSLSIASPQFLIIPLASMRRLSSLHPLGRALAPEQADTNSKRQPSSVKLVANRFEI